VLAELFGEDLDGAAGQTITIGVAQVEYQGKQMAGLRIQLRRAPKVTVKPAPAARPAAPVAKPAAPVAKPAAPAVKKPLPVKKGKAPSASRDLAIESIVAKYTATETEQTPELLEEGLLNVLTILEMDEATADWSVVIDRIDDAFVPAINSIAPY
jgi:hypothetical protein